MRQEFDPLGFGVNPNGHKSGDSRETAEVQHLAYRMLLLTFIGAACVVMGIFFAFAIASAVYMSVRDGADAGNFHIGWLVSVWGVGLIGIGAVLLRMQFVGMH